MASKMYFYDTFYKLQWSGMDLGDVDVKVRLLVSDYEFDAEHENITDVLESGTELELPTENGYVQGGESINNSDVILATSPNRTVFQGDDVIWEQLTATFRWAVYHIDGSHAGVSSPVLCCVLLDDTPADINVNGVDYRLMHSTSGIFSSGAAE